MISATKSDSVIGNVGTTSLLKFFSTSTFHNSIRFNVLRINDSRMCDNDFDQQRDKSNEYRNPITWIEQKRIKIFKNLPIVFSIFIFYFCI